MPQQATAQWRTLEMGAYAAFVFLVTLVFSTRLEAQFSLPKLLIIRIFASILAGVWLVRFTRDGTRRLPRAVPVAAAALGLWWVLSTLTAVHPPTALHGAHGRYNGLWTQLLALSFFLIAASSRFGVSDIERLAKCLVAAMVLAASYALVQFAGWDPITWPGQRPASTIGNPVVLAAVLGLALPFALVFLLLARRAGEQVAWAVALAILLAGSISTLSRGPLAASAAALLLVLSGVAWEQRQRISRWAVLGVVVILTIALAAGYRQVVQSRERLTGAPAAETDRTLLDRFNTYAAAIQMVRDHPVTGVGLENFSVVYPRYRSAESERLTPDVLPTMVHNGYLHAAATTGIPGLLAYLALIAAVLIVLVRGWLATHERRERWLILAFIAAVAGYLIQDLSGWLEISL
ncbi:MAG: O-antigen ligase family protein, partial [Acidobacteriota bacterium]|nr:O-antigen ligase family protein [Acidobacteriota bacterium]